MSLGFVEGENHTAVGVDHTSVGCDYTDWDGHAAFVCGSWIPNTEATNWGNQYYSNDMGPIVWPSTGYFDANGYKVGNGCANNATIQADDGYLYVFYKDQSNFNNPSPLEGRHAGIKVARAPIGDALNPQAYQSYYKDPFGVVHWNPSLPPGFNKEHIHDFLYGSVGPQASVILSDGDNDRDYTRFAVAKVRGKNYYLGVGSYQDHAHQYYYQPIPWIPGQWYSNLVMVLMWSDDLVNWHDERIIDREDYWASSVFNYPIFLSADGWSNTSVDENDFYLVGTNGQISHTAWLLHMTLPQPPPPPPVCYDGNGNVISCDPPPQLCYDEHGNPADCQTRRAVPGSVAALDISAGGAPIVTPNPGPGIYQVKYAVSTPATTQLNVFDLMGRRLQTGQSSTRRPGTYTETIDISGQARGVYLLELLVNGKRKTFKIVHQ